MRGRQLTREAKRSAGPDSTAFLLAQVGAQASEMFAKRILRLRMTLPQVGLLRIVAASEGQSQRALAAMLSVVPSKLVQLVDELEGRGLIERRTHPTDRRTHALFLTARGRQILGTIGRVAREHEDALLSPLSHPEREQLASFLKRIAQAQGLTPGVHPGFRRLGRKRKTDRGH